MQKLLLSVAFSALFSSAAAASPGFDVGRILNDIKVLSSDEYEGRAPASEGEKRPSPI